MDKKAMSLEESRGRLKQKTLDTKEKVIFQEFFKRNKNYR